MHTNAVDARRAMALVEQADVDGAAGRSGRYDNSSNSYAASVTLASAAAAAVASSRQGGGGKPSAPAWEVSRVGGVGGRPDDAAALVRRAKALGVPPLPPDLGAVRAPNGAKYSHYLLDSGGSGGGGGGAGGGGGSSNSASSGAGGANSRSAYPATAAAAAAQQEQYSSQYEHGSRRPDWRPRQGVLVASLREHGGAVNRLALSQDQAFFVSASSDSTCKVWELRGMDHTVNPQSRATYSRQSGRLLDLCMVDNSHSVASASSDGTVHVWRVELAASASSAPYGSFTMSNTLASGNSTPNAAAGGGTAGGGAPPSKTASSRQQHHPGLVSSQAGNSVNSRKYSGAGGGGGGGGGGPVDPTLAAISATAGGGGGGSSGGVARVGRGGSGLRVCGSSMVRCVSPREGAVVSVHHFNTELGSPLVYGTRKGGVRSWDLRAREEPWALRAHPELGFLTVIALGTEKTWLVVGTSRGFVMLWDLRFQARRRLHVLARLWRHSSGGPIHKLATCSRLPPPDAAPGPHVIVAAGRNEAAIWDVSTGGACKQCFRVVPPSEGPPPSASSRSSRGQDPAAILGAELPVLEEVSLPSHPNAPALSLGAQLSAVRDFSSGAPQTGGDPAIRALVGRISRSERDSYLITGGTDRCIRYWDFQAASRCYMVSGREPFPGRPSPRTLQVPGPAPGGKSTVVLYYDEDPPPPSPASLASRTGSPAVTLEKGLVAPRSSHDDAVLDVKVTELPTKMLLSGSRDGAVKIWK
ncbi:unnamed protein product [Ectocarpus sp. 12 AP-2014]